MRVKQITAKDPAQNILMSFHYDYDKIGNILTKKTEHGNYTYRYDDLYRLTGANNPVQDDEAFTYDPVGNRITSRSDPQEWSCNRNNELLGYGNVSFAYDDNGNMVQKTAGNGVTHYVHNLEHRLERVEDGTGSFTGEGRRS